jgi:hypothetical protein
VEEIKDTKLQIKEQINGLKINLTPNGVTTKEQTNGINPKQSNVNNLNQINGNNPKLNGNNPNTTKPNTPNLNLNGANHNQLNLTSRRQFPWLRASINIM